MRTRPLPLLLPDYIHLSRKILKRALSVGRARHVARQEIGSPLEDGSLATRLPIRFDRSIQRGKENLSRARYTDDVEIRRGGVEDERIWNAARARFPFRRAVLHLS